MEELINKLKEFKASEGDKAAKEMEETIKQAIEQLQEKDKVIDIMGRTFQGILVSNEFLKKCVWKRICKIEKDEKYDCSNKLCEECVIEYFTKKAREV